MLMLLLLLLVVAVDFTVEEVEIMYVEPMNWMMERNDVKKIAA